MTRGRLVVHAHFYQPFRADPFSGEVPAEPSAAPFRGWNDRIAAECYRPNAERGNLERISFDLGPTLATWLAEHDAPTHGRFVEADRPLDRQQSMPVRGGNAMAQSFHHTILPLAAAHDRRTEIRWGIRDFRVRFGRQPVGIWLPETAVDLPTLRTCAEEGIRHTILAPWQASEPHLDTRMPYRTDLGDGLSMVVVLYDGALSAAVSFEPAATADAERFARERVALRFGGPAGQHDGLVVIATDGELYGHHQPFRDLFLQRLVRPDPDAHDRGFDVVDLATAVVEPEARPFGTVQIAERTSWSCHHGVARWSAECPDASDGRWKGPLRAAFDRLAGSMDALTDAASADLAGRPDPWAARDDYVDVVIGQMGADEFATRRLGRRPAADAVATFAALMEAQRWRLAMYASDGWFWDDPIRLETKQILRAAARAARLMDAALGSSLEGRLVADLGSLSSPSTGQDGAAIYRQALLDVGQPPPA